MGSVKSFFIEFFNLDVKVNDYTRNNGCLEFKVSDFFLTDRE